MARLLVHVEGQTEEMFVNEVLSAHLLAQGYERVRARILGNPRLRHRGGIKSWPSVKREIVAHLRKDAACVATTMVDFYGLPSEGGGAWPGGALASGINNAAAKAEFVEQSLASAVMNEMGHSFDPHRFIPYIVMHEFKGLLFSDCGAFARAIGKGSLEPSLQTIRDQFETPEEINDSPNTARHQCESSQLWPGTKSPSSEI